MRRDLHARARRLLHSLKSRLPSQVGGVFHMLPDETPEEALLRAEREGRSGGLLVMPQAMTDEQAWEVEAAVTQEALASRAGAFILGG